MMQSDDELLQQRRPNQDALLAQLSRPTAGSVPGFAPGEPTPGGQPEASPVPQRLPQDFSRLTWGYNPDKLKDFNHQTAKYQMGRALSAFDPRQGITSDVLAALNSLGFGNFGGSGQKLSLSGLTDAGRNAGLRGDYSGADFIEGFSGGNGRWQYADPFTEAQESQQAMGGGGGGVGAAMGSLSGLLQGNPMAGIQAALGKYSKQGDNLKALLAQLNGGQ